MTIKISVIVPCFNAEPYLREAIGSARLHRQAVEVIIVDDGSTDGSLAIAEQLTPIVKIVKQVNSGVSAARNAGIAAAAGEYCLFLDADDLLVEGAVDRLSELVEADGPLVMMGSSEFVDRTGCSTSDRLPARALFPTVLAGNLGIIGSWMAPTEQLRRLGGFRRDMARDRSICLVFHHTSGVGRSRRCICCFGR